MPIHNRLACHASLQPREMNYSAQMQIEVTPQPPRGEALVILTGEWAYMNGAKSREAHPSWNVVFSIFPDSDKPRLLGMSLFALTGSKFPHSTIPFVRSRPVGLPRQLLYTPLQYGFSESNCERIMSETTQTFLSLNIDLFVVATISFGLMIWWSRKTRGVWPHRRKIILQLGICIVFWLLGNLSYFYFRSH